MAFNLQTFKIRTRTALVFAAVMLTGLLWNQWSFIILFFIIHIGCWIEYQKLIGLIDPGYKEITSFHKYGVIMAGCCLMLWFTKDQYQIFGLRLHELGWWVGLIMVFLLPLSELLFSSNIRLKNIGLSIVGFIYISLCWGLMLNMYTPYTIQLHDTVYIISEKYLPVVIIAAIWINDTMAYIVGSFIGKNPLSDISPRKTWEGTIGGILLSIGVVGLLSFYLFQFGGLTIHFVIIAAIAAITGTLGDLLESKLKRMALVKDSGSIMPGHGGFLDRFDSLLLATPFVWLYVQLWVK